MLFMVIEHFRPGQAAEVYRRFRDSGRMAPAGLRYIDSWVDFEIIPVRTSAEAAAAIAPTL